MKQKENCEKDYHTSIEKDNGGFRCQFCLKKITMDDWEKMLRKQKENVKVTKQYDI